MPAYKAGQVLLPENLNGIVRTSDTVITIPAGVRFTLGGQQYTITDPYTIGTSDIDTGAIAAVQLYYIHAVIDAGVLAFKFSLSSSLPSGFLYSKVVGIFTTNASSQFFAAGPGTTGIVLEKIDNVNQTLSTSLVNIITLTLPAGTWQVSSTTTVNPNGTTNMQWIASCLSLTSVSFDYSFSDSRVNSNLQMDISLNSRVVTTTGQTVYLVMQVNSTAGGPPFCNPSRIAALKIG